MDVSHTESSDTDSEFTPAQWLEQLKLGSDIVGFETCWYRSDDSTPAFFRAIQGHCSRPIASPDSVKTMIEIPHEWTNEIYHSSFQ